MVWKRQPISSRKRGKALVSQKFGLSMQLLSMYCNYSDCMKAQDMKPIQEIHLEEKSVWKLALGRRIISYCVLAGHSTMSCCVEVKNVRQESL